MTFHNRSTREEKHHLTISRRVKRERERERERQTDRQTDRQRQRQKERQRAGAITLSLLDPTDDTFILLSKKTYIVWWFRLRWPIFKFSPFFVQFRFLSN